MILRLAAGLLLSLPCFADPGTLSNYSSHYLLKHGDSVCARTAEMDVGQYRVQFIHGQQELTFDWRDGSVSYADMQNIKENSCETITEYRLHDIRYLKAETGQQWTSTEPEWSMEKSRIHSCMGDVIEKWILNLYRIDKLEREISLIHVTPQGWKNCVYELSRDI